MNYEQFVNAMIECTRMRLSDTKLVEKQEILKNNGVTCIGISIRHQLENAAPVIYLEEFYLRYCRGEVLENLAEELISLSRSVPGIPDWDYHDILDFRKIRHKIAYKLINAKKNEKLLKEIPNLPIWDLALVFYVSIKNEEEENCSVLIRNTHMNYWKLPLSVLYQCAKENTPKLYPSRVWPLEEFVHECFTENIQDCPLLVLTNETGIHGASVVLYPKVPKRLYEAIGKNYYLLPSSIHEFLVFPENRNYSIEELRKIVREVNENHVAMEDVLSDSIYYFNGRVITKM